MCGRSLIGIYDLHSTNLLVSRRDLDDDVWPAGPRHGQCRACSRSPILSLRPLRRLPFRLGCPRLHTSPSTHTHPSPPLIQSVGVDDHKVPPNETDQVQPIDRGMGRQIKVYLGQLLDEWLDDEDNLEKWESNKLTASNRRILLAHWFYKASMKALQGEAKRKYFEHALVPCSQPMARTTTSSSWRAPPPATRW